MPRVKTEHGVTLYYESVGEGPPMIFHSHHHRTWMFAQVPYFSRYFQVVTYDRRGTGRSDCPPGDWSAEDLSRDCVGLMNELGFERAIIAGASTGGLMTMQFGVDYPDRAAALVATNFTWWMWDLMSERYWGPLLEGIEAVDSTAEIINLIARASVQSWEWEDDAPALYGESFEKSEFIKLLEDSGTLTIGESREALRSMMRLNAVWDLRPRTAELERLDVPALIMVGDREPTHLVGNAWDLHKLLPKGDFVLMPGHHMSRFEQASRYNREILKFLERNKLLPSPCP